MKPINLAITFQMGEKTRQPVTRDIVTKTQVDDISVVEMPPLLVCLEPFSEAQMSGHAQVWPTTYDMWQYFSCLFSLVAPKIISGFGTLEHFLEMKGDGVDRAEAIRCEEASLTF